MLSVAQAAWLASEGERMRQTITPERERAIDAMSYDDYLLSPEFARKRFLCFKLYEERCALCYAPGPGLECHHRTYARFKHERQSDLIALCKPCHDLADERRRLARVPLSHSYALAE